MPSTLDLLRLEIETLFITDQRGRLVRTRTPDERPRPLLAIAACPDGLVCSWSASVPEALARQLDAVVANESPADLTIGWVPAAADELIELTGTVAPIGEAGRGLSYVVDHPIAVPTDVDLLIGGDDDRHALEGLMPDDDRERLDPPWAVAMVDGRVAAVCETARSASSSVEAGLWVYDEYRRRGLGTAVAAAWTSLVTERTAFYSTNHDNLGSQGVARRLGLRPLGYLWHVSAPPTHES